jgi:hypothetical protein
MTIAKDARISKLQWLWNKMRYGLFLQVFRNVLSRIGLEIKPYYWVQEGRTKISPPAIKGNEADYALEFLGQDDMKTIGTRADGYNAEVLLQKLKNGKKCIGLKFKDEIAAFMWIDFNSCNFTPHPVSMKENEAYLFSMYTMHEFRGKNLAPYLRYKSYEFLKKHGKDTFYSVSEYLNYSTIKFKKKLNARNLKLILYIELFKKFRRSFTLREY